MKSRSHREAMGEIFKEDVPFAAYYLSEILNDGNSFDLLIALGQMIEGAGGQAVVAEKMGVTPNKLREILSLPESMSLKNLLRILTALNMRLVVQALEEK